MKRLGTSFLLVLLFHFEIHSQCGGYLDCKQIADSCYASKKYVAAAAYYVNCLKFNEAKRVDYYYATISLIKNNKIDSALYYFKIAGRKGLHYFSLESFNSDTTLKNLSLHNQDWKYAINKVYKNTEKYINRTDIDSCLLKTLISIKIEDQKYRGPKADSFSFHQQDSLWKIQKTIDEKNQKWLKNQLSKKGWPKISEVGVEGDRIAWLIVQHSDNDTAFQRKCLKILKKLIQDEETNINNLAYLEDRLLINNNKPQIYGTQFQTIIENEKVIDLKLKTTIDIDCLNKRRAYMKLQPVEEYLEFAKKKYIEN